jgi:hypothetical protein
MNNENNFIKDFNVGAEVTGAVAVMLIHIVSALSEHPNFDRKLLIKQIQSFPDFEGNETFHKIYRELKEQLLSKLSEKSR